MADTSDVTRGTGRKARCVSTQEIATGSTAAIREMFGRYVSSPLVVDVEYITNYMAAHKAVCGTLSPIECRAECHAYAMEHLTPVINLGEPIVGQKTRYPRGAVPYCNYASSYILRELGSLQVVAESQDEVTEVGSGGGIQISKDLSSSSQYVMFGKKFLLPVKDVDALKETAQYFSDKCMQSLGDKIWMTCFPKAAYITNGWKAVLYTAAHDPAPEGRFVLDYETALRKGFNAIIAEMEDKIANFIPTGCRSMEQVYFWRAGIRVLRGVLSWVSNYQREAQRLASVTEDPRLAEMLTAIAERCSWVPANPPRNFHEAVQSFWFVYLAGHLEGAHLGYSPGRFDYYMYPYFMPEWESGSLTEECALELLEALRMKMTMVEYVASFSWEGLGSGNLFQNMMLGGVDEDGSPADSELSMLVIQSAINCRTTQPTLSLWYTPQLQHRFLMKAVECVKTGVGFPAFFNLPVYIQHELERSKQPLQVIRKYASMGGCTEPTLGGMSYGIVQPGFVNHMKLFELALYGGKDPRTGIEFTQTPVPRTLEELMAAYVKHMTDAIGNWQKYWNYVMAAHRQTCNLVFCSVLTRDCIGRGLSLDDGGALWNGTPTTLSSGMVNVVNSLAAIKFLLGSKLDSMETLRNALMANWKGYEDLLEECKRAPKWGNNNNSVDSLFTELFSAYCSIVSQGVNFLGERYDPSMLAISTHAPFGKACLATPDGRKSGDILCDGVTSPAPGTDACGPYAVLLSAAKVDHTQIRGGLHNMKFHPSALSGPQGSRKLLDLIRTYFQRNGFQLQFNVVDSKLLREAQLHPENYRHLIVRVAGFSAFFVELARSIQDEVIQRTEHNLSDVTATIPERKVTAFPQGDVFLLPPPKSHAQASIFSPSSTGTIFNIEDYTVQDGPGQLPDVEEMVPAVPTDAATTVGKPIKAMEIIQLAEERHEFYGVNGGVTLSGGEPLMQAGFVLDVVRGLKSRGISVGMETSGCVEWGKVSEIFSLLDFVYFDVKCVTEATHKQFTGISNKTILSNLPHAVSAVGPERFVVSIPLIPGFNTSLDEMELLATTISAAGVKHVRILPFHSLGASKYPRLSSFDGASKRTWVMPTGSKLPPGAVPALQATLQEHNLHVWVE
ncbi:formate acetyltransferase [Pelomyxa schiedti]|nr:formate acetyltransferase [Pelomyxa schiedti]